VPVNGSVEKNIRNPLSWLRHDQFVIDYIMSREKDERRKRQSKSIGGYGKSETAASLIVVKLYLPSE
jgi:hypothetical protein